MSLSPMVEKDGWVLSGSISQIDYDLNCILHEISSTVHFPHKFLIGHCIRQGVSSATIFDWESTVIMVCKSYSNSTMMS